MEGKGAKLQKWFDVLKYKDSQKVGKDTCGTYEFCKYCNKKNKYPCAAAIYKFRRIEGDVYYVD